MVPEFSMTKLSAGVVEVGKAIPFNVYDAQGQLLLQKSFVIDSRDQLERLYECGMYARPSTEQAIVTDQRKSQPFLEFPALLEEADICLTRFLKVEQDSQRRLKHLSGRILDLCRDDADACLALAHTSTVNPSSFKIPLLHAFFVSLIGRQLQWPEESLRSAAQAALIANVGYLSLQEILNESHSLLSDEQRSVLRKHPDLAVDTAIQAGITDAFCLNIIQQHHEKEDGSGYPLGQSCPEVLVEAQVLNLAERYTALIFNRAYRERLSVGQAQQVLAMEIQNPSLYQAFSQVLSPFPPGVLVRLASQEIAVVTHRTSIPEAPRVRAIISAQGSPYHGSFLRDCTLPEFRILHIEQMKQAPILNSLFLWGTA